MATKNVTPKLAQRSHRLLKLLAHNRAFIEETNKENCSLLNFEGLRKVGCDQRILTGWANAGFVSVSTNSGHQRYLCLTHKGRQFLRNNQQSEAAEQHRAMTSILIKGDEGIEQVEVNAKESPLASLYLIKRKGSSWLADAEFQAGERLRADFEFSLMGPRITASWDPNANLSSKGGRRPHENLNERAMGARQRLSKAIDAVGPELSGVLLDVCCFLKGIEQVERERQWPRRSAKLMLKAALSALSRHYNPEAKGKESSATRHWGASDFKPQM